MPNPQEESIKLEIKNKQLIKAIYQKAEAELLSPEMLVKTILQEQLQGFKTTDLEEALSVDSVRAGGKKLASNISQRLAEFCNKNGVNAILKEADYQPYVTVGFTSPNYELEIKL